MSSKSFLCSLALLGALASIARADIEAGVDWHVKNAEVIALVEEDRGADGDAVPQIGQRVRVKQILKGVDTSQEYHLTTGWLSPGQNALVLFQYDSSKSEPARGSKSPLELGRSVWPMDRAEVVDVGEIPLQTQSGLGSEKERHFIKLEEVKALILESTPEQVGLCGQVLDALLFPEELAALARSDPSRARYVQLTLAILDLARDTRALARLVNSSRARVRSAAVKKLEALTGLSAPAAPSALDPWLRALPDSRARTIEKRWPPVPATEELPADAFPAPLLKALQENDAAAIATEFPKWLDSGVLRDRQIRDAFTLDRTIVQGSNLQGAIGLGAYLPPAPRLRPDVVVNDRVPVDDRMKAIALYCQIRFKESFAREQREAGVALAAMPLDSDLLRRAAFWELPGHATLRARALFRLRDVPLDEAGQRFLFQICLSRLDDSALGVIQAEIKAQRQPFLKDVFEYVESHRDRNAGSMGRTLCLEKQRLVIPIMLRWLQDEDPEVRRTAAHNLCFLPDPSSVAGLVQAIPSEAVPEVKTQMLVALAQTGDKRGLEFLLAAAREPKDTVLLAETARGLGRIRDAKALPVLAKMVARWAPVAERPEPPAGAQGVLWDAVYAFDYIQQVKGARRPDEFNGSSGGDPAQLHAGMKRIEQWRRAHPER